MTTFQRPLRIVFLAFLALSGLGFTACFVMILLGDPEFPAPLEVSPEDMAAFAARYEQVYPNEARTFTLQDGTKLAAQSFPAPSQTTVVLVHGILGSSFGLNRSSGLLREAASAEVVALDLRGHGGSGGTPGDIDYIGQYEDDLGEVIAQIRTAKPQGRVILAGHSMGGGISLRYAMKPGLPAVNGYLFYAPYLGANAPTARMEETEMSRAFLRIHLWRSLGLEAFNSAGITAFNGLRTLFFNLPKEMPLRSYSYRATAGMAPADCGTAFEAISQPMLLVVGSADEAFRADRYEATIRPHSKGEIVMIDGASHDEVMTDPRTLAEIRRWSATLGNGAP